MFLLPTEENLKLIEALFANVDKGNQGTELLLWSVREILKGELVLQGGTWIVGCSKLQKEGPHS